MACDAVSGLVGFSPQGFVGACVGAELRGAQRSCVRDQPGTLPSLLDSLAHSDTEFPKRAQFFSPTITHSSLALPPTETLGMSV